MRSAVFLSLGLAVVRDRDELALAGAVGAAGQVALRRQEQQLGAAKCGFGSLLSLESFQPHGVCKALCDPMREETVDDSGMDRRCSANGDGMTKCCQAYPNLYAHWFAEAEEDLKTLAATAVEEKDVPAAVEELRAAFHALKELYAEAEAFPINEAMAFPTVTEGGLQENVHQPVWPELYRWHVAVQAFLQTRAAFACPWAPGTWTVVLGADQQTKYVDKETGSVQAEAPAPPRAYVEQQEQQQEQQDVCTKAGVTVCPGYDPGTCDAAKDAGCQVLTEIASGDSSSRKQGCCKVA